MSALLSANELRLSYGYQTLLDGVTLAVSAGEKVGLVGRNGCGKTSLLKILTGSQQADSGEISPESAAWAPVRIFNSEVFPQPFRPTRPTFSPAETASVTPSSSV